MILINFNFTKSNDPNQLSKILHTHPYLSLSHANSGIHEYIFNKMISNQSYIKLACT